jgi:hypothetical protein
MNSEGSYPLTVQMHNTYPVSSSLILFIAAASRVKVTQKEDPAAIFREKIFKFLGQKEICMKLREREFALVLYSSTRNNSGLKHCWLCIAGKFLLFYNCLSNLSIDLLRL